MARLCALVAALGIALASLARAQGDELSEAKKRLEANGVRVFMSGVVLANESSLAKEIGKAARLRKELIEATKAQQALESQKIATEGLLVKLRQQHVFYSAQLATNNPNNVARNNSLIGSLQVIEGQADLKRKLLDDLVEKGKSARAKATAAREAYIQFTLDSRKLANEIAADYQTKAADPEIKAALDQYNKLAKTTWKLVPSSAFHTAGRKLAQIEETVLSESIPLIGEGRNVARVSVTFNDKHQQDMMVDSGASIISLPYAMAEKFGLKPTESDPKMTLQLADGREIEGRRKIIAKVRVGKFTVENVECAVLGEDAVNAEPLLGMSFLGHFKFEIDADAQTLTMVKIAGAEGGKTSK